MELQSQNTLIFSDNQVISSEKEKENGLMAHDLTSKYQIFEDLICEAGRDVYNYLERNGYTMNTNVILLSSIRHYIYESEELKQVKTVINLKLINNIRFILYCLKTMNRILPIGGTFIGGFIDSEKNKSKSNNQHSIIRNNELVLLDSFDSSAPLLNPIYKWVYKVFNNNNFKIQSKKKIRNILERNGFIITDMTEINGVNYFISKKVKSIRSDNFPNLLYFKRKN
jgi:hypothetical protein